MIMTGGDVVRAEDLPGEIGAGDATARAGSPEGAAVAMVEEGRAGSGTLREFKDAAERAYLVQKLRETNWNISKTAEIIDTPRSNLYKKLEQYGIKQEVDG
jgi:two-component system nitrogen regulation response regulator NtrX